MILPFIVWVSVDAGVEERSAEAPDWKCTGIAAVGISKSTARVKIMHFIPEPLSGLRANRIFRLGCDDFRSHAKLSQPNQVLGFPSPAPAHRTTR